MSQRRAIFRCPYALQKPLVRKYLEDIGLDTSKITFELLGDSDPQAKAEWIANRIDAGATDVLFFDDSGNNVAAVQELKDIYPGVKIYRNIVDNDYIY